MSEAHDGAPEGVSEDTTLASQVEGESQDTEDEDLGEDTAAPTDDASALKPKLTARERVQQAVARQREAERDRDFYREQALRNQAPAQPAQVAPQLTEDDGRPDPADYEGGYQNPDFIEALTDWKAEAAAERLSQRQQQRSKVQTTVEAYHSRTKALYPEGKPAGLEAFERIAEVPAAVNEIVGESEIGPKIAAYLGDNPAELRRLFGLSVAQQARELTRLEQRLEAPPRPTPKTATDAPEPPPQARGGGGRFKASPDTDDFATFDKEYG